MSQLSAAPAVGDLNLLSGLMPSPDFDLVCGCSVCDRVCFTVCVAMGALYMHKFVREKPQERNNLQSHSLVTCKAQSEVPNDNK